MPSWRIRTHRFGGWVLCLALACLILMGGRFTLLAGRSGSLGTLALGLLFTAVSLGGIALTIRCQRRIVSAFEYDASEFRYRTLGGLSRGARTASDIERIEEWSGRQGPLGYVLAFSDRHQLYVEHSVSHSTELAHHVQFDLRSRRQATA
jgi:hypothetical protein